MKGSTYRRCSCRDPKTGKELGTSCPKRNTKSHCTYSIRQELSPRADGSLRSFARGGYDSRKAAQADLDHVRALLGLAESDDPEGTELISAMLAEVSSEKTPLPDVEETRRRLNAGQDLVGSLTVSEWLDRWLAGKRIRKSGISRYETDVRVHRRGEACGRPWSETNRDRHSLTVTGQLVQDGWDVEASEPKTDSGFRVVALDDDTVAVLERHRKQQAADRAEWGPAWVETGLVFTQEDGSWLHPGRVTDLFERLVAASGLPPIRLHDLRHGSATLMLAAGIDVKIVSDTLGHSDTRITRDIYQSVLPHVGKSSAEATAKLVPLQRKAEAEKVARKVAKAAQKAKEKAKARAKAEKKKKARKKPKK